MPLSSASALRHRAYTAAMVRFDPLSSRSDDLRRWSRQFTETTPIAEVTPRQHAIVVGVVHKMRILPGRALETTVEDGTGRLTAEWVGRSQLPGVGLGTALRLSGTVAVDSDGRRRMRNPEYQSVAEPYT